MKTIKDYTSFVNENIKEAFVDVELDQDVVNYYLDIIDKGVSKEDAIEQVAADFGISDDAVRIIVDEMVSESVETEEEEETEEVIEESVEETEEEETEEVIEESVEETEEEETEEETEEVNEASDEDEYLTPKQKKLPEGLKKGIIAKAKKAGKKVGDKDDDKKDDKKDDDKKDDKKDDSSKSDEDKYLTAKQKKLPEGLKKAIIKKAKAKK